MEKRDAEPLAAETECVAPIRRPVVEVEGVGEAVPTDGRDQEAEHVDLLLGVVGLEGDHVARRVVEQPVDAERPGLACDEERGPMANVAVPECTRPLGLPLEPGLAGARAATLDRRAIEALVAVEPPDGRGRHGGFGQSAIGDQGAEDERHRGRRVLAPDVEQERALLRRELAATTAIRARPRHQRQQPTAPVGVVPALEGRHRVAARERAVGQTERGLGQRAQLGA
jgi:hypothetical protein